jgi:hypothetical protein
MSTSPPPARGNPTRQQLDELDALLQRMLALPLNQLDQAADLPADDPPPAPRPTPPRAAAPPPAPRPVAPPPRPVPAPPAPVNPTPPPPGIEALHFRTPPLPEPAPPVEAVQPVALPPAPPPVAPVVTPPPRPTPWASPPQAAPVWLRVMSAVDAGVFGVLGQFGPLGRALGRPAGRDMLGVAGLLAMAAAAVWMAADWFGWTW